MESSSVSGRWPAHDVNEDAELCDGLAFFPSRRPQYWLERFHLIKELTGNIRWIVGLFRFYILIHVAPDIISSFKPKEIFFIKHIKLMIFINGPTVLVWLIHVILTYVFQANT